VRPGVAGIVGLWSFAVAQPLYELFARQPTFLLAHDLTGVSLLIFVTVVSLVPPLALALGVMLLRPEQHGFGRVVEWLLVLGLQLLLGFYLAGILVESENPFTYAGIALGIALLLFCLSVYSARFLELVRFSAISALLFAGWFLFVLPDGYVRGQTPSSTVEPPRLAASEKITDIVLLVFDELPLSALVDEALEIRADLFPNIAKLVETSDWYTQTSTVAARTRLAVPGLLTGKMADPASSPDFAHHPVNLFSLLAPFYDLNVFEPVTKLCDLDACSGKVLWRKTIEDTLVVYAHLVVPRSLRSRLPQLTGQWGGFLDRSGNTIHDDRLRDFGTFLERMAVTQSPGLHFFHSLYPHIPYSTLPTGHRLYRHGTTVGHVTSDQRDEIADRPGADVEARYLFRWQLQLVDRLVGQVIDELRRQGRYEQTLFIVTADHGLRIQPGLSRRQPFANNYIDIASVPLIVKRPAQRQPQRIDRPFETIDLLPLVLEIVGIDSAPYTLGRRVEDGRRDSRQLRSHMEFLDLPDVLDLSGYQQWWPAEENVLPTLSPEVLASCAGSVELHHPELYRHTHPEHFLAAHMLIEEVEGEQQEVVTEFNGGLYRALQTAPGQWSAFLAAEAFKREFNSVRIIGKEAGTWCELYSNGAS